MTLSDVTRPSVTSEPCWSTDLSDPLICWLVSFPKGPVDATGRVRVNKEKFCKELVIVTNDPGVETAQRLRTGSPPCHCLARRLHLPPPFLHHFLLLHRPWWAHGNRFGAAKQGLYNQNSVLYTSRKRSSAMFECWGSTVYGKYQIIWILFLWGD